MSGSAQSIIAAVVIGIVSLIGLVIAGGIVGVGVDMGVTDTETALEPAPTEYVKLDADVEDASALDVSASTGTAVALQSDGYVEPPTNVTNSTSWTFMATADPDGDPDATYGLYAERNATLVVLKEGGNWTARYNASGDTAYVEGPAAEDRQSVGVEWANGSDELRLYVNGTLEDSAAPTATTEPRNVSQHWNGSIDEVRAFDTAVGGSVHSDYHADGVQPLDTTNASLRLMFNDGRLTTAYRTAGDAEIVGNASTTRGVQPPEMVLGDDYEVDTGATPTEFRVTSAGYLADAPVVLIEGASPLAESLFGIAGGLSSAMELVPVVLLLLIGSVIISAVARTKNA